MWHPETSRLNLAVAPAEFWGVTLYLARSRRAQGVHKAARVYRLQPQFFCALIIVFANVMVIESHPEKYS